LATVVKKGQVPTAGRTDCANNQHKSFFAQQLARAVAKGRAAHAFRIETVGLFHDEGAGAYGSQGRSSSYQEEVANSFEQLGKTLDMIFQIRQVGLNRGSRLFQFLARAAQVTPRENAAQPLQGHKRGQVSLARPRALLDRL